MTDNEIIKDLKQCEECHYYGECEKSVRKALDLINCEDLKQAVNRNITAKGEERWMNEKG